MAFVLQPQPAGSLAHPAYVGLSTDVRPVVSVENVTLYELDTRRVYVWREREWHLHNGPAAPDDSVSRAMLRELILLRRGLELYLQTDLSALETE